MGIWALRARRQGYEARPRRRVGEFLPASVNGKHYRGTSLIRSSSPPQDHHRSLGIGLLQGPAGEVFLMSEVPL